MAAAVGVFQHLKDLKSNILGKEDIEIEEFPSEYSEDYNVSRTDDGKIKILAGSGRSISCHHLPSSPVSRASSTASRSSRIRKVFIDDKVVGGHGDSGFNSDPGSCSGVSVGVYSDCLEHYGLDGPLLPLEEESGHSGVSQDKLSDINGGEGPGEEAPSVTSTTARKRKEKEVKAATIRQHYYPEGGWGYIILCCASLVNILAHGLQLSFSVMLVAILKRWPSHHLVGASEFLHFLSN